jgi:putrescine aminotransferase
VAELPSVAARYARHVNPSFVKLLGVLGYGRVFTRAKDVWIWDDQGRKYLDFLAGFGSVNLGHNHPELLARLRRVLDEDVLGLSHVGPAPLAAALGEALAARLPAPLEVSIFANGGGDAVEQALKLARAATRRPRLVAAANGFHGTNLAALSLTSIERMRAPFEPLLPGCELVPFGDLDRLERALRGDKVAAFLVEPVQAEGGVIPPPPGYLAAAAALCQRHGTLLVLDEVQTGLGRTGRRFAFEAEGVVPDLLCLAKGLSGGLVPVAATVTSRKVFERGYGTVERFDLGSSTFAGNALSCAAALATLEILDAERLTENAAARGEELLRGVRRRLAGHPLVKEVRGRGLLVGVELGPTASGLASRLTAGVVASVSEKVFGHWAAVKLLERGVVCQPAAHAWSVLKLEPPLTVTEEHVAQAVDALGHVLDEYRRLPRLVADVAQRLGTQGLRGWGFP